MSSTDLVFSKQALHDCKESICLVNIFSMSCPVFPAFVIYSTATGTLTVSQSVVKNETFASVITFFSRNSGLGEGCFLQIEDQSLASNRHYTSELHQTIFRAVMLFRHFA